MELTYETDRITYRNAINSKLPTYEIWHTPRKIIETTQKGVRGGDCGGVYGGRGGCGGGRGGICGWGVIVGVNIGKIYEWFIHCTDGT